MGLSDRAEEILENLWARTMEDKKESLELGAAKGEAAIDELCRSGHAKLSEGLLTLTKKGEAEGRQVARRHRLAERLFSDVLAVKKSLVHPVSCRFEHLLHEGIDENICVLLGHPKTCPHGRPIPEGDCCRKARETMGKAISSLDGLEVNQRGKVAYLHTKDRVKLQKLMAMGISPGMGITLIQKFPSYVFKIGESQFAVDRGLAENIFVRLSFGAQYR